MFTMVQRVTCAKNNTLTPTDFLHKFLHDHIEDDDFTKGILAGLSIYTLHIRVQWKSNPAFVHTNQH